MDTRRGGKKDEGHPKNGDKKAVKRRHDDDNEDDVVALPEKKETPSDYLRRKAEAVQFPTEEAARLQPKFIFADKPPLVVYFCSTCQQYNASRKPVTLPNGLVDLREFNFLFLVNIRIKWDFSGIALCLICRANLNSSRTSKFYHFTLPLIKRDNLETSDGPEEIEEEDQD
ncbi:hypothetical protein CAEBREN_03468 [Caenorhabditis brenneri]|uniref:Uncharacterized protein n=1 Tax=Caenorhabditis brenneri TaxID=135651 RepID=G0P5Q6_CAEBE|nr:hypothetical protein CAEBREN_03468 [Caenorhabditis brenneri]